MIEILVAFSLTVREDPMTDNETYMASIGGDRGGITVFCGPASDNKLAVEFHSPRRLERYSFNKAKIEWRFDDGAANSAYTPHDGRRTYLVGRQAAAWVSSAQSSSRIRVRLDASYDGPVIMDAPITSDTGALAKVIEFCNKQ